jgi:UDP:flavonoid glycosyltransferase YjiC (YdhE family)
LHLLVALTPHGYGHIGMTAPVVNELRRRLPELRLTIQGPDSEELLARHFSGAFQVVGGAPDFGMRMRSSTEVDVAASASAYAELHADFAAVVAREAERLRAITPDLILANIPYVTLAAAARAGIPAVALSCLNWADIYGHYCGGRPEAARIQADMLAAYGTAEAFLRVEPALPMTPLANLHPIGPIARIGADRRANLQAAAGVGEGERVGLIAFGGIPADVDFAAWPRLDGWRWIAGWDNPPRRPDFVPLSALGMAFTDALRSADAVIGKPGYATFAEAGVNGTPMLYVERPDWPETPYLTEWLGRHTRALAVPPRDLVSRALAVQLQTLLAQPARQPAAPLGISQAADWLHGRLTR